jgi:hypothetical protein
LIHLDNAISRDDHRIVADSENDAIENSGAARARAWGAYNGADAIGIAAQAPHHPTTIMAATPRQLHGNEAASA